MPGTIEVFKAALGNQRYLNAINRDAQSQAEFIKTLVDSQYTPQEIHEVIALVEDSKVRSLLIIHLLSQASYLASLEGEPITDRIRFPEQPRPSRLNAWVHQLEISTLTPALIKNLVPEAAVSILCSIPHFHQLTGQQVTHLLNKYLDENLIIYWIKNYSLMPNAPLMLAHLINSASGTVLQNLNKLNPVHKKAIINTMIEHLCLFTTVVSSLSSMANEESYLILANGLYLNGHHYLNYTAFIKNLIQNFLKQRHLFSLAAIEQLFSLSDVLEREKMAIHTAPLINRYIKAHAQKGDISLFYKESRIHSARMSQTIHANTPEDEAVSAHLNTLFHLNTHLESPLIQLMVQERHVISYFDYFLIYYNGPSTPLDKLLQDYLNYHTQQKNTAVLHHLSVLLSKKELRPHVRNALFNALLHQPKFHDEQINLSLLLYDVTKTIQYYGLQGGAEQYQTVLKLCALALKKINAEENKDLITVIKKAQYEAKSELALSIEQGIFSKFIKYIKRCWIYGWTGFFIPNRPVYVVPESVRQPCDNLNSVINDASIISCTKTLPALLAMTEFPLTQEKLNALEKAHSLYSLKDPTQLHDEFETRLQLHNLYLQITSNDELYPTLISDQNPFLLNHFRLLELALKTRAPEQIMSLIKQIDANHKLRRIADEFDCIAPQPKAQQEIKPVVSIITPQEILTTAKERFNDLTTGATTYALNGWSWAESFFSHTQNTTEAKNQSPATAAINK